MHRISCFNSRGRLTCFYIFKPLEGHLRMQYGNPFLDLILVVLKLYSWALIVSVILSWLVAFNVVNTHSPFVSAFGRLLYRLTEPLLRPIRRLLPDFGGIDISPVVLLLLLWFVENLLITYWPF